MAVIIKGMDMPDARSKILTKFAFWQGDTMNRLTKIIGCIFIGGWALFGTILYIKAVIDFIAK